MKVAKSENRKEILLKDIFEDFNKDDLKDIAKMKGIKGISKLNKGPLIETIIEKIERYSNVGFGIVLKKW